MLARRMDAGGAADAGGNHVFWSGTGNVNSGSVLCILPPNECAEKEMFKSNRHITSPSG